MLSSRHAIAVDLGRRRLRALLAVRGRAPKAGRGQPGLKIKRALIEDYPADMNLDDPQIVGQWVGERLRAAGFPAGRATVAIGREHVVLKRITLPTADDAELPDMTRLAMQRELPFPPETAVIDFLPVERSGAGTTVLAVAVPQNVIDFAKAAARVAGWGIERISLRTMGAAALLNTLEEIRGQRSEVRSQNSEARDQKSEIRGQGSQVADDVAGPDHLTSDLRPLTSAKRPLTSDLRPLTSGLAVDVLGEGVEFCLVADGTIRFSRAAEVPQPQDQLAIADAVVTETRRTWMSYRVGENSSDVGVALIMGDRRVSAYAAGPVAEMLKIPVQVLEEHPLIDAAGHDMDRLWPLAGLLLEPVLGGPMIDFANTRKAPDLGARTRQRRLAIAGAAIILLGLAATLARQDHQRLTGKLAALKKEQEELAPSFERRRRDTYKIEHLRLWESVRVDWLKHASYLATIAPPPEKVVLDSWAGTLDFRGVNYDRKTRKWSVDEQLTILIDGEAKDRETADAFRDTLVKSSTYTTSSTGADAKGGKRMPYGFTYRLRTKVGSPAEPSEATPPGAPAKAAATPPLAPGSAGGPAAVVPPSAAAAGAPIGPSATAAPEPAAASRPAEEITNQ